MSVIPRTKVILFSNRYLVLKSKLWLNTIVTALSQVVYFYNPISSELCNIRKKKIAIKKNQCCRPKGVTDMKL